MHLACFSIRRRQRKRSQSLIKGRLNPRLFSSSFRPPNRPYLLHQTPHHSRFPCARTLLILTTQVTRTRDRLILDHRIIPPFRPILAHDIEMSIEAIRVRARTPLLVSLLRTPIRHHNNHGLASPHARPELITRFETRVGELEALPATPAAHVSVAVQLLRAGGRVDIGPAGRGRPGKHAAAGSAAAGADSAVVVVCCVCVAGFGACEGCAGAFVDAVAGC